MDTEKLIPLEAVRKTLLEIEASKHGIYKETDLTPAWQQSFCEGRVKDPGYTKICTLINWLRANHFAKLVQITNEIEETSASK